GIARMASPGGNAGLATQAGELLGTPAYMAPEQVTGDDVGPPADVYSTATVLYELLTGRLPLSEEGGAIATAWRHASEDAARIREVNEKVGPRLASVVMTGLARDPANRYQTADALGTAIAEAATYDYGSGWLEVGAVSLRDAGAVDLVRRAE